MSDINLNDIVSLSSLNRILKSFHNLTGFPVRATDRNAQIIAEIGTPEIYTNYICKMQAGQSRLDFVHNEITAQSASKNAPVTLAGVCGMNECAIPVVVNGECVGTVIAGPVFFSEPTASEMEKAATELFIDTQSFKASATKLKTVSRPVFDSNTAMLFSMVRALIEQYSASSAVMEQNKQLIESNKKFGEIQQILGKNANATASLIKQFDVLDKLTQEATTQLENTSETVKTIQNIALNTRILGFNASIEASRAKESGKGFGVIAQEVRSLADISKSSAEKIEEYISRITEIANEIRNTVLETREMGKMTSMNRSNMASILQNVSEK